MSWRTFAGVGTQRPFSRLLERREFPRFRKDLLRVGRLVHGATGEAMEFTAERLARLARDTNAWIAAGKQVAFQTGDPAHNMDARNTIGFWSAFSFDGETLWGELELRDRETIDSDSVGSTITQVSVGIMGPAVAADGKRFDAVVQHVAATPQPAADGQGNFVRLAVEDAKRRPDEDEQTQQHQQVSLATTLLQQFTPAERACIAEKISKLRGEGMAEDQAVAVAIRTCAPEKSRSMATQLARLSGLLEAHGEATMEKIDGLKTMLGLPADADEAAVIEAVRAMFAAGSAAAPAAPPAATPTMPVMDTDRKRIAALEAELAATRRAAAVAEIERVDELCLAAGVPLGEDRRKGVLRLFEVGDAAGARLVLDVARTNAEELRRAVGGGTRALASDRARAEREHQDVYASSMVAAGYRVERDGNGAVTKLESPNGARIRPPPLEA